MPKEGPIFVDSAVLPLLPHTRERRIGWGRRVVEGPDGKPLVLDELAHEEFAVERWSGVEWIDTNERRIWWLQGGVRMERRYRLRHPELGF